MLVWIIIYQKNRVVPAQMDQNTFMAVWMMKKSIWDTYFSEVSTAQLGSMVFFTQSKLGIVIIPYMHSSSGKIRNCLPRRMIVDKTYWSCTV
jgi:hypothetical protein